MIKKVGVIIFVILLSSCLAFKKDVWLNKFDVCCVVKPELLRDGGVIEFSDGYFQDRHVKTSFEYDVISGIKVRIYSTCLYLSEINWNDAVYTDEYGEKRRIIIKDNAIISGKAPNITVVSPYNEIEITLIPVDKPYKKKGVWNYLFMLDERIHPRKLLGRKTSLEFLFPCDDKIYSYTVNFKILPRYLDFEKR